jgi:hypothetical protein
MVAMQHRSICHPRSSNREMPISPYGARRRAKSSEALRARSSEDRLARESHDAVSRNLCPSSEEAAHCVTIMRMPQRRHADQPRHRGVHAPHNADDVGPISTARMYASAKAWHKICPRIPGQNLGERVENGLL